MPRTKKETIGIKAKIEDLKAELERLIEQEASFNRIYEISVRLDKLIVAFYKNNCSK